MSTIEALTCGCKVDVDAGLKTAFCPTHDPARVDAAEVPRDYFHEALRILAGKTMLLPQREHLEALAREHGRDGTCVCGQMVAEHFSPSGRFRACAMLRRT